MLSLNVPLIFLLMQKTETFWDEETFREIRTSLSFGQVQRKLAEIDDGLRDRSRGTSV
jgi:hypothetical protein